MCRILSNLYFFCVFLFISIDMSKYFHFSLQSAVSLWPFPPKLHLHLVRLHFPTLFLTFSGHSQIYSVLYAVSFIFFLQMMCDSSRWTSLTQVRFPPHWAAPSPSPVWCLCPPRPPPPLLPLSHRGSSGPWCPAGWRRRSWWRGVKGWRSTRRTETALPGSTTLPPLMICHCGWEIYAPVIRVTIAARCSRAWRTPATSCNSRSKVMKRKMWIITDVLERLRWIYKWCSVVTKTYCFPMFQYIWFILLYEILST